MNHIFFLTLIIISVSTAQDRRTSDSLAASLYAEGNYWKVMEISKPLPADSLSPRHAFVLGMSYAALSESQRAAEMLRRAVMLDSSKLQYRYQYARLLTQTGLFAEAEAQLLRCIAMDSTYVPAQFQLGLTYAAQKNVPEKELALFSSIVARTPNDFLAHYYLADALKRTDRADSASFHLRSALQANPRYLPALIALANYLSGQKRTSEALAVYLKADSIRGDNKDLKFQIGESYRKLNDGTNAKRFFRAAIAMDTTNALYYAQLAYTYFSEESYDSSAIYYNRAIAFDDENPQYYRNLALVHQRRNDTLQTIAAYRNAVRVLHPEVTAYMYYDLATYCMNQKRWAEAIDAFQGAVGMKPDLADAYYFIGSCHMQLDHPAAALTALTTYLKIAGNDKEKEGLRYSARKMVEMLKKNKN